MPTPQPFNPDPYQLQNQPGRPPSSRMGRLVVGGVLLLLAFLLGIALTTWATRTELGRGPTPTPTATGELRVAAATPDFRATQNLANLMTQEAYRMASLGIDTPTPLPSPTATPLATATPTETPVEASTATPDSAAGPTLAIGTSTATRTPIATEAATETATQTATVTPSTTPTETPTATATATPTQTPLPGASITPVPALVSQLIGRVSGNNVLLHTGPSQRYPTTGPTLAFNQPVLLLGHDGYGEWVYVSANGNNGIGEIRGWVRQADAQPSANPTVANLPPNANINDVRWLPIRTSPDTGGGTLTPTPTPSATLIPASDYPLIGQNRWNQASVDRLPLPPYAFAWAGRATAAQGLSSNVTMANNSVLVASDDGHLYSFEYPSGNQRWRLIFNNPIPYGASIQDRYVYVVDLSGTVTALLDQGNRADPVWSQPLNIAPSGAINIAENQLLISTSSTSAQAVFSLDRFTTQELWRFNPDPRGNTLQRPTVGHQMVYVGGRYLWAIDLYTRQKIWQHQRRGLAFHGSTRRLGCTHLRLARRHHPGRAFCGR